MKKLSTFNKIIFLINTLVAIGLILSFFLPNFSPNEYGLISLAGLLVPVLIIANVFFVLYWIFSGFKKQLLQSFFVLLLSLFFTPKLYKFNGAKESKVKNSLSIMSYNVRKFNKYDWIKIDSIEVKISNFITKENPDVVLLQEYKDLKSFKLNYPYHSNPLVNLYSDPIENAKYRTHLSIYSKYPIINERLIRHTKFLASTMFVDIVKNDDTLRVYNFHLASLGVVPDEEYFGHKDSEKLVKRLRKSFRTQQNQIDTLNAHIKQCNYKVVLAGDLNNTAYSWAYKNTKNDLQDTFSEAGEGFGTTYKFKGFPLRIDYIFVDQKIKINTHKNYEVKYSDHYPISTTIEF